MASGGASILSPVCAYVAERTGSSLSPHQVGRLKEVLARRLVDQNEERFLEHLRSSRGASDLAELMSAIAVHKTDLFRDEVQLAAFRQHVLSPLVRVRGGAVRVWSAGCATGEEVATLLILLAELGAHPDSRVLGTDISAAALKAARTLSFHPEMMRRVPSYLKERYFQADGSRFQLNAELRARASFAQHNLMDTPYPQLPGAQGFDVIFCRNVLIYFTDVAFDQVVGRLADRLELDGTLVLSSAEPIIRRQEKLATRQCGQAFFYSRPREGAAAKPARAPAQAARSPEARSGARPAEKAQGKEAPAAVPDPVPLEAADEPAQDPREEAQRLFQLVLELAAVDDAAAQTEQGLRKCLYLDPHLAQARYLLGMLLEQRGAKADAAAEYRRAYAALAEGRSRAASFFLNNERLKAACQMALKRTGFERG